MAKYNASKCKAMLLANALIAFGWALIATPLFTDYFSNVTYGLVGTAIVVIFLVYFAAYVILNSIEELP